MDRTVAGLIGVVALTAGAMTSADASQRPEAALRAASYAELLKPIPNALAVQASMRSETAGQAEAPVVLAQYHHHHHRRVYHRRHYHHNY